METAIQKTDIQALQDEAIRVLHRVSAVMENAGQIFDSDDSKSEYIRFHQQVLESIRKVEQLELRLAIVAPMKAGKSTIINAIVGQKLLPSQNTPCVTKNSLQNNEKSWNSSLNLLKLRLSLLPNP